MHIVNNTSAMIMEHFDKIMFVSVLYINDITPLDCENSGLRRIALRHLLTMVPQQVVPGETEAADGRR